jgi:aminoglycoside phosphotransferase (APT) family kinase protein
MRDLNVLREALVKGVPEGARITGLVPLTTGHSNDTFLVEGLDQILRLPPTPAAWLAAHGVIVQARVYEEVGKAAGGPPVPKIFHVGEDVGLLGAPFFLMERVAGESVNDYNLPDWFMAAPNAARAAMCADWIAAIAGIARLRPLAAFGGPISPEQEARRWRQIAVNADCAELVGLFDRLLARPARLSGPSSPVHGDCKIANMMFSDGRLSAVLDWELGYNGEPLSDLGYLLYFFESDAHEAALASRAPGMWKRDQVIAAWEAGSGRSASGVEWYEASAIGKIAAILLQGLHFYQSGHTDDPRFLRFKVKLEENMAILDTMLR